MKVDSVRDISREIISSVGQGYLLWFDCIGVLQLWLLFVFYVQFTGSTAL